MPAPGSVLFPAARPAPRRSASAPPKRRTCTPRRAAPPVVSSGSVIAACPSPTAPGDCPLPAIPTAVPLRLPIREIRTSVRGCGNGIEIRGVGGAPVRPGCASSGGAAASGPAPLAEDDAVDVRPMKARRPGSAADVGVDDPSHPHPPAFATARPAKAGRSVHGRAVMTCASCGASDGLVLDARGWRGGLCWRVSRGADAICCLGPDDPWLPALRRREPGSLRLRKVDAS